MKRTGGVISKKGIDPEEASKFGSKTSESLSSELKSIPLAKADDTSLDSLDVCHLM